MLGSVEPQLAQRLLDGVRPYKARLAKHAHTSTHTCTHTCTHTHAHTQTNMCMYTHTSMAVDNYFLKFTPLLHLTFPFSLLNLTFPSSPPPSSSSSSPPPSHLPLLILPSSISPSPPPSSLRLPQLVLLLEQLSGTPISLPIASHEKMPYVTPTQV